MSESQVPVPPLLTGPALADWAEATMLVEGRSSFSRAAVRQRLSAGAFLSDEGDEDLESQLDLLFAEVDLRSRIAPSVYPFDETATGLIIKSAADPTVYEFLLWLSESDHYRRTRRYREIEELFDALGRLAVRCYMGPGSQAVVFAANSSDGRPVSFEDAIDWLATRMNLPTGAAHRRPQVKDGGVDIVAWKPFRDLRSGYSVLLCQCTVQKDWVPKTKDIIEEKWMGWIDLGRFPMTALIVPFAIPATFDRWDEVRRSVTVILDRFRICELITLEEINELESMRRWCKTERELQGTEKSTT